MGNKFIGYVAIPCMVAMLLYNNSQLASYIVNPIMCVLY